MRAAKLSDYIWARAEAGGRRRGRIWDGLLFAAAFACLAQDGRPTLAAAPQNNDKAASAGNTSNDAKPPVDGQANSTKQQKTSTESARRRQISDESTQLLAMAEALKVEVDKTTKDTLSLSVIRKADEIERLAKTVKDKMKQGSGQS